MKNLFIFIENEKTLQTIEKDLSLESSLDAIVLEVFYDMCTTDELFIVSCEIESVICEDPFDAIKPKPEKIIFDNLDTSYLLRVIENDWEKNGARHEMIYRPAFSEKFLLEREGKFKQTSILEYSNELVLTGWNRKFSSSIDELVFVGE